jgi:hypothetical protein
MANYRQHGKNINLAIELSKVAYSFHTVFFDVSSNRQETTTMQETQLEDCKVSSLKIPVICEFQTWYLPADGEFCLSIDYMHPY